MCFAHIAKHLFGPGRFCSEQTAKTSNPSLNSTSAPTKHSSHRKGTLPFSPLPGSSFELVWSYGNADIGDADIKPIVPASKSSSSDGGGGEGGGADGGGSVGENTLVSKQKKDTGGGEVAPSKG